MIVSVNNICSFILGFELNRDQTIQQTPNAINRSARSQEFFDNLRTNLQEATSDYCAGDEFEVDLEFEVENYAAEINQLFMKAFSVRHNRITIGEAKILHNLYMEIFPGQYHDTFINNYRNYIP